MKKIQFALTSLLFLGLPLSFAHADPFFNSYAELYAVGSDGSTVFQSNFTLNEKPWIFVQFYNNPPAGALNNELTLSSWQSPNVGPSFSAPSVTSSSNQIWLTFSQSQWDSIKTTGQWDTTEKSFDPSENTASFFGQASFTVDGAGFNANAAPEPVGTVLFLTGALIMGTSILLRKKAMLA